MPEQDRVDSPRCPHCHKKMADWVTEAKFTCRYCKTEFIVGSGFITLLTTSQKGASVEKSLNN